MPFPDSSAWDLKMFTAAAIVLLSQRSPSDRPSRDLVPGSAAPLSQRRQHEEETYIARIVRLTKGNRSKTAGILRVIRKTLWEKINACQLDFERSLRNNDQYY